MKLLLAAIAATFSASALASETELPPPVPSEAMSIRGQVPPVPSEVTSIHEQVPPAPGEVLSIHKQIPPMPFVNLDAGQFGAVTGSSVSNIGSSVPTFTPPAIPAINIPRIR